MDIHTDRAIEHIESMQKRLDEYKQWDYARSQVIEYLEKHYGLEKPTDWMFKTLSIFNEHQQMKA